MSTETREVDDCGHTQVLTAWQAAKCCENAMLGTLSAVEGQGNEAYRALAKVFSEEAEVLTVWRNLALTLDPDSEFPGYVVGGVEVEPVEASSLQGNLPTIVGFQRQGHAWVKIQEQMHAQQTAREKQAQTRGRAAGALAAIVVATEVVRTLVAARRASSRKSGRKNSLCCECVLSKVFGQSKPQKAVETVARRRTPFGGPGSNSSE